MGLQWVGANATLCLGISSKGAPLIGPFHQSVPIAMQCILGADHLEKLSHSLSEFGPQSHGIF